MDDKGIISINLTQKVHSFSGNEAAHGNIPSLIGCFIADKAGMTLFTFEIHEGALEQYLKASVTGEKEKKQFDIEVIPMFMSALERFSKRINIQEVPRVSLCGRNLRMQALFNFEDYLIIFLLQLSLTGNQLSMKSLTILQLYLRNLSQSCIISPRERGKVLNRAWNVLENAGCCP